MKLNIFNRSTNCKQFSLTSCYHFRNNYKSGVHTYKATIKMQPNSYDETAMLVYAGKVPVAYVREEDKNELNGILRLSTSLAVSTGYDPALNSYSAILIINY